MPVEQANKDRRDESYDKLHTLTETRTETLSLYNQLANMRPFNLNEGVPLLLAEFCEALVDYTASAHFQLYRFIEDGSERRQVVKDIASDVYGGISHATNYIVSFNDKYDGTRDLNNLTSLDQDLSALGEVLADRITLEDKIIAAFRASAKI